MYDLSHRIHGAGIYANIDWGYIDGIHGAPYFWQHLNGSVMGYKYIPII